MCQTFSVSMCSFPYCLLNWLNISFSLWAVKTFLTLLWWFLENFTKIRSFWAILQILISSFVKSSPMSATSSVKHCEFGWRFAKVCRMIFRIYGIWDLKLWLWKMILAQHISSLRTSQRFWIQTWFQTSSLNSIWGAVHFQLTKPSR